MSLIKWFNEIDMEDINLVGGKNASLGEMYSNLSESGIKVPNGFAITTIAYDLFVEHNKLNSFIDENIKFIKNNYSIKNLKQIGMKIRNKILNSDFPQELEMAIIYAYIKLSNQYNDSDGLAQDNTDVAVRSSGTAEDLPDASFAGQQETYLNVRTTTDLLLSVKRCIASLFTDRAISYRTDKDISCLIKLSVGVQKMVRSDLGSAGVAFSIDTETGFKNVIVINGAFGLGELVVSGQIKPDEIILFKPKLNDTNVPIIEKKIGEKTYKMVYGTNPGEKIVKIPLGKSYQNQICIEDKDVLKLGKWIRILEKYYTNLHGKWCPLDVEWAIDGLTKELFLVQARPETVISKTIDGISKEYHIVDSSEKKILIEGVAVGDKITTGKIKKMYTMDSRDSIGLDENVFEPGSILVTEMTDPNWEPIMKISSGIITNKGGRTCHASIVARELGIPAVVGTLNATELLEDDQQITLSCGEGEIGKVYQGKLNIQIKETNFNTLPKINTSLMLNVASPEKTFKYHNYPVKGVGLVRQEFIFNNYIKIHPLALLNHKQLNDKHLTKTVEQSCIGYDSVEDFFIKKVAFGISKIAATFYDHPVIVRFSDFKSNEYYNLLGGKYYEPKEENPMIGWRGASRYYSKIYKEAFGLECKAIKYVRDIIGLDNVIVMIPFCRTPHECQKVIETMEEFGLKRGVNGLQIYLMCEIPSNVILAEQFAKYVDGFSIGSNDLTQLTLGLDRDSELVQHIYDERDEAVKYMMKTIIQKCKKLGKKIGICGQGPSDYPEVASYLVSEGIDSISVTPDSVVKTIHTIYDVEQKIKKK
jgi:pyruvate, water dikinase